MDRESAILVQSLKSLSFIGNEVCVSPPLNKLGQQIDGLKEDLKSLVNVSKSIDEMNKTMREANKTLQDTNSTLRNLADRLK